MRVIKNFMDRVLRILERVVCENHNIFIHTQMFNMFGNLIRFYFE